MSSHEEEVELRPSSPYEYHEKLAVPRPPKEQAKLKKDYWAILSPAVAFSNFDNVERSLFMLYIDLIQNLKTLKKPYYDTQHDE